jgi:transcriptional regulator with XRE-family HTH domain
MKHLPKRGGRASAAAAAAAADIVEGVPDDPRIGSQIRELRRIRGVTLQEMSARTGKSVGYLSQVERNQSKLPIGVLRAIADVLGVEMHWFFQPGTLGPSDERDIVVRAANRRRMRFTRLGVLEELLSPDLSGPLELLLSTIEPGADSGDYAHRGAEAGLVIEGQLDLWVGGRMFRLAAGDSFAFRSIELHRCRNPGSLLCRVVWVITPPHY